MSESEVRQRSNGQCKGTYTMEKRSRQPGIARSQQSGVAACARGHAIPTCPGGRQDQVALAPQGGGYQKVCSTFQSELTAGRTGSHDPRLDDLRAMGMHHTWQKVAAEIGIDAFLAMWRILDADAQFQHPKGGLELTIRRYKSYLRYQRNRYILQMNGVGYRDADIKYRLAQGLSENLAVSHISNIVKDK